MKLGDQLKELLKNEPKQAAIASALGVAAPTLSQWLSGAELCNPAQLSRIVTEYIKDATTDKEAELLRLLLLLTGDRIERDKHDAWTEDGRKLALAAVRRGLGLLESRTPRRAPGKRTLADFPDSFYPLAVISGDKREVSQSRINFADFGAVSSSPAETRWILRLGLRPVSDKDLQFFTDKV
jgi:transcriptional regulator with XRE-family HTH domain